jgi:glycosyltransferase involved in cell wall biosynthesis
VKVLLGLTDLFDARGGIQTFNRSLVKALDKIAEERGWNVAVLVLNDRGDNNLADRYLNPERTQYRSFKRHKLSFAASMVREALNASIVILGHVNFASLIVGLRLLRPRLKMFLAVYGIDVSKRLSILQRYGVRRVNRILSISASTRSQMVSRNGLDDARFDIVPCTLEPLYGKDEITKSREELSLPLGKMILTVSRLEPSEHYKRIDLVIEAMPSVLKEVPNTFHVIVGDGSDRQRLEEMAENAGVRDKVYFVGHINDEMLPSYYRACDLFVLPSTREGFGIVFLEAMYCAKPCIGARAGGVPEVIQDGKTGLLAEPDETEALTERLIYLLKNDELCQEMGKAGKQRLDREFSFEMFRSRLQSVLFESQ